MENIALIISLHYFDYIFIFFNILFSLRCHLFLAVNAIDGSFKKIKERKQQTEQEQEPQVHCPDVDDDLAGVLSCYELSVQ